MSRCTEIIKDADTSFCPVIKEILQQISDTVSLDIYTGVNEKTSLTKQKCMKCQKSRQVYPEQRKEQGKDWADNPEQQSSAIIFTHHQAYQLNQNGYAVELVYTFSLLMRNGHTKTVLKRDLPNQTVAFVYCDVPIR